MTETFVVTPLQITPKLASGTVDTDFGMDLYGDDRKLSELGEGDLDTFLDHDVFSTSSSCSSVS